MSQELPAVVRKYHIRQTVLLYPAPECYQCCLGAWVHGHFPSDEFPTADILECCQINPDRLPMLPVVHEYIKRMVVAYPDAVTIQVIIIPFQAGQHRVNTCLFSLPAVCQFCWEDPPQDFPPECLS